MTKSDFEIPHTAKPSGWPNSIETRVPLRKGQDLSVKRHCKGALKHVVGSLYTHAALDPTGKGFVFSSPKALLKSINKKHPMSRRTFFSALAEARSLHIVSEYSLRRVRHHKLLMGMFVTHPEALCVRDGSYSVFKGKIDPPPRGRWREENGVTYWAGTSTLSAKIRLRRERSNAPPLHSDCTPIAPPLHSDCTAAALKHRKNSTPDCTAKKEEKVTGETVQPSANDEHIRNAECNDQCSDQNTLRSECRAELIEPHERVELDELVEPHELGDQGKTEKQTLSESLGSSFQRHEDEKGGDQREGHEETVLQHFDDFPVFSTLAEVSGERLNLRTNEWAEFGTDNQYSLLRLCNQILVEIAKEPWAGDATLARIMDQAATRFIRSNGNVPKSWLKVRSDLRDGKANTAGTQ